MKSVNEEFNLRAMWAAADAKAKDYRDKGEVVLLKQMHDAFIGLKECGWREIDYCPKDGTLFLAISAGSIGVFPHYYQGEWPDGHWWAQAHGDLWPARPVLFKPMPPEHAPQEPLADAGGESTAQSPAVACPTDDQQGEQ